MIFWHKICPHWIQWNTLKLTWMDFDTKNLKIEKTNTIRIWKFWKFRKIYYIEICSYFSNPFYWAYALFLQLNKPFFIFTCYLPTFVSENWLSSLKLCVDVFGYFRCKKGLLFSEKIKYWISALFAFETST